MTSSPDTGASPPELEVFWRPGCPFCRRLFGALDHEGITYALRNIWEDDEARRFVAEHNRGNETVPTVVLGSEVLTNPPPRSLVQAVLELRSAGAP